ncbi:MAG: hypothetical protein V4513_07990 [Pseudomonadota bacterium]
MSIKSSLLAQNHALYLPAISETFARSVHRGSLASSLPLTASDLNFLDPNNRHFFYPFALYSAGQAAPANGKEPSPCMVTKRDRAATMIVGDSGGYQIQSNKIEFDPENTVPRMLRWLEQTADWSMVLDFPTGGISSGEMRSHAERLQREGHDLKGMSKSNGLAVDYNACLVQTKINNNRFRDERTLGATRLLNVLQGRSERESKHWYDAVKHYPFEGWAFAGAHKDHFSLIVRRLLDLHSDGLLAGCKWIHVLGVGSLQIGCLLTAVQRAVREATGCDVQFSFDSATAFRSAAMKSFFLGHTLDDQGWSVQYEQLSELDQEADEKLLADVLFERLQQKQRDARSYYPAWTLAAQKVKLGNLKDARGKLSGDGYNLLMHHNVEGLLKAHSHAQGFFFGADPLRPNPTEVPLRAKIVAEMIRLLFADLAKGVSVVTLNQRIDEWAPRMDDLAS